MTDNKIKRKSDHWINKKCLQCKKRFKAARSNAKFCSTYCRVKHNRRLNILKRLKAAEATPPMDIPKE